MNADELFLLEKNQTHFLEAFGDWRKEPFAIEKYNNDIAKIRNYIENYFYHATGGFGESGVGKGLYLGKDKYALDNFYNLGGTEGTIITYYGKPNFIDLTNDVSFNEFVKKAKHSFDTDNFLSDYTLSIGYDGIRYYDIETIGEEFVLFNTNTVKRIDEL